MKVPKDAYYGVQTLRGFYNYNITGVRLSSFRNFIKAYGLIKKACNIKSGSAVPNKTKVATLSQEKLKEIAELKMPDLNAASLEAAMSMIAGTARSMGVTVEQA